MSHRDSVAAPPEGATVTASSPAAPIAAFEDPERAPLRRPVPPGGRAHAAWAGPAQELPLRGGGRAADVDGRGGDRGAGRADPRAGRLRAGALRFVAAASTRRSRRCSCTRRSATSSSASSSTTACCGRTRPRRSSRPSSGHFHVPLVHVSAEERFLGRLEGVSDPEDKRKAIGEEFIRVFEEESTRLGKIALPRAGNALLRRDRVGRRRRGRGEDQVAPQRRRPARGHGDGARRAAAPAVQGRGAARRRGARAAGGDGLAPAVPGAGARDPHHRRGHARAARDPARGRRDPAGRGAPRRPLPRAVAVVRRAAGDPLGRRAGRRADVRLPDRRPRGHLATTR